MGDARDKIREAQASIDAERERAQLESRELRDVKRTNRLLEGQIQDLKRRLGFLEEMKDWSPPSVPIKPRGKGSSKPTIPVFVASDWHCEEDVDPKTLNGLNAYNPDIFRARARRWCDSVLSMLEMFRSRFSVKHILLPMLGDFVTGHIHEDNKHSTWLLPTEACWLFMDEAVTALGRIAKEHPGITIHVPCTRGNHGRATDKMLSSVGATHSYEWLVYQYLARYFHDSPADVRLYVSSGYFLFMDLWETRLRMHHGDWIRYAGGVGGISIPLYKAIAEWNKDPKQAADLDVMGHWHQCRWYGSAILNGSLIGYNTFAQQIKAVPETPYQTAFTVHPGRGLGSVHRVWVTDREGGEEIEQYVKARPQWIQPPGAI